MHAFGANWYVNDGSTTGDIFCSAVGNNANNGSTISTPKRSLKDAYALASSGDVIYIDAGTYTDSLLTIPVAVRAGTISLIGAGSDLTIFDGSTAAKRFLAQSGFVENFIMQDFTISGYTGTAGAAAFTLISQCTADLTDVIIKDCSGARAVSITGTHVNTSFSMDRGGFFCNTDGALQANHFSGCQASLDLNRVAFINNSGVSYGAAISIGSEVGLASSSPTFDRLTNITIDSCIFDSNTGTNTSAVYILNSCTSGCSDFNISYCDFTNNTVSTGSSSYGGALVLRVDNTWNVKHCKFDSNDSGNSVGTLTVHTGVVDVDSCYFNNNTANAGEGQDFYSYVALADQEASPYFLNDPTVTFTNCSFNSSDDQISRFSSSATINLDKSGTPTNSSDYSGDGLANTYTWSDLELELWDGDCGSGYTLLSRNFYWVDGDGNWTDFASHWVTESGGSEHQTYIPNSSSSVYFDSNSDIGSSAFNVTLNANGLAKNINYNNALATFVSNTGTKIDATSLEVLSGNMNLSDIILNVSSDADVDGTLTISTGKLDVDGEFDATGGTIDFTNTAGEIALGGSVTSLGTLDNLMGTVEYDGTTQNVVSDNYYNLTISTSGTKTALGNINIDGNLVTEATDGCILDLSTNNLNLAGDLNIGYRDGLIASNSSCTTTFDGSSLQSITHAGSSEGSQTTIVIATEQVGSSTDDSFEYEDGAITYPTSNNLRIGNRTTAGTGVTYTGLRFQTVPLPKEANILSATLEVHAYDAGGATNSDVTTVNLKISAEAVDNSTTFTADDDNIKSRTSTSSQVDWDISESWADESTKTSVDFSSVIQEIVDRSGWSSNNSINILIQDDGTSGNYHKNISQYDRNSSEAAKLDVSYNTYEETPGLFYNLVINNSANNISLNDDIYITNNLDLTSGDIITNANAVTFSENGTTSNESSSSHVVGSASKTTKSINASFTFPIGDGTNYRPISISETSSATTTEWTASYTNSAHPDTDVDGSGLDHISEEEYWDLDRTVSNNAKISLTWTEDNGVTDYSDLVIAHYDGSTDWDMITSTPSGTNTSGTITSDAVVTTFSPFTIGSTSTFNPLTGAGALPIQLISFNGEKQKNYNVINWSTASEKNNNYFTVEKTKNGKEFYEVGRINGAGNSNHLNSYTLSDLNVEKVINYYRLVQTDLNGIKEYTKLISIDNRTDNIERYIIKKTNLLGQEINEYYQGVIINLYSDGTTEKVIKITSF